MNTTFTVVTALTPIPPPPAAAPWWLRFARAGARAAAILLGLAVALLIASVLVAIQGCAPLPPATAAELAAAEPAILAADKLACDETAMIPVAGAAIDAIACPLEEAAVRAAIDKAIASATPPPAVGTPIVKARAVVGKVVERKPPPATSTSSPPAAPSSPALADAGAAEGGR